MRSPSNNPCSPAGGADASALAKARIRREAYAQRNALPAERRAAWSAKIRERVLLLQAWRHAQVIGLYASFRGEVDTMPLVEEALAGGKRIAFPRADTTRTTLSFYRVQCVAELSRGAYGILEPSEDALRHVSIEEFDLLFVPGLAFDPQGQRLGFGGGYYDRVLAERAQVRLRAGARGGPIAVGLAFECQVRRDLPVAPHDRPVDALVTEVTTREARGVSRDETADP
ncbi:MAG: 5-formyltetrahydrofolate cyclo-ligase [Actinobacteria bacterium RBG_13_63_9]|jgi:5-formyltetrahydrofolate cyclo-ligase|nr:MAG: 5-formyltetrahydrofolate cyclo-ligase [Actinobacteria bacterium RBG_13_63_9]